MPRPRLHLLLLVATVGAAGGCRDRQAGGAGQDGGARPDLRSGLYALVEGPSDPLVEALCSALHRTAPRRRGECCMTTPPDAGTGTSTGPGTSTGTAAATGATSAAECVKQLGYALRGRAVRLDAAEVDRCHVAMATLHEGCDWVGFEPLPAPPACRDVVHGLLPRGAGCRSSIECEGKLHCEGLSPSSSGTCQPPHGHGTRCTPMTGADDPLAALVLDDHLDETHPWCAGHCERDRCVTPITAAGPCETTDQCAPGFHCAKQRCFSGWLPKSGQPCTSACERPARCLKGTCTAAGKEGTPCAVDDECVGRCVHQGETGRCGPPCSR